MKASKNLESSLMEEKKDQNYYNFLSKMGTIKTNSIENEQT